MLMRLRFQGFASAVAVRTPAAWISGPHFALTFSVAGKVLLVPLSKSNHAQACVSELMTSSKFHRLRTATSLC